MGSSIFQQTIYVLINSVLILLAINVLLLVVNALHVLSIMVIMYFLIIIVSPKLKHASNNKYIISTCFNAKLAM